MKVLLILSTLLASSFAAAKTVAVMDSVEILYMSERACNNENEYSGIVANGYSIIVANLGITNGNKISVYGPRPWPIKTSLLKALCEDSNGADYTFNVEDLSQWSGGVIVGVERKNGLKLK